MVNYTFKQLIQSVKDVTFITEKAVEIKRKILEFDNGVDLMKDEHKKTFDKFHRLLVDIGRIPRCIKCATFETESDIEECQMCLDDI